jgi:hypothetical protein
MTFARLQSLAVVFAVLLTGVVIVSLIANFHALIGQPFALVGAILLATLMVWIIAKSALTPSRRYTGWVRSITGPNGRWLFLILLVLWGLAMGYLASLGLGPQQAGAPALVGLFIGIFLFMGFIWSVIGE